MMHTAATHTLSQVTMQAHNLSQVQSTDDATAEATNPYGSAHEAPRRPCRVNITQGLSIYRGQPSKYLAETVWSVYNILCGLT